MPKASPSEPNAFKRAQVRYRQSDDKSVRNEWLDFGRIDSISDPRIRRVTLPLHGSSDDQDSTYYRGGPVFGLEGFPGFLYAPQALATELQLYLASEAVTTYCEPPHVTNLMANITTVSETKNGECRGDDEHDNKDCMVLVQGQGTLWDTWKEDKKMEEMGPTRTKSGHRKQHYQNGINKKRQRFRKLSWATMGYHYDWTQRVYRREAHSDMPTAIQRLAEYFANLSLRMEGKPPIYTASACIVNYYTTKSLMGGHRDDLEYALEQPIVSLSVGLPAIFLLGGLSKDDCNILPILVRPGDVMLLGGASRLRYHGMVRVLPVSSLDNVVSTATIVVPKPVTLSSILPKTSPLTAVGDHEPKHKDNNSDASRQQLQQHQRDVEVFLRDYRININVRQVYSSAPPPPSSEQ